MSQPKEKPVPSKEDMQCAAENLPKAIIKHQKTDIWYSDTNNEIYRVLDWFGYFDNVGKSERLEALDRGKFWMLNAAMKMTDTAIRSQIMRAVSEEQNNPKPHRHVLIMAKRVLLCQLINKLIEKSDEEVTNFQIEVDVKIREYLASL